MEDADQSFEYDVFISYRWAEPDQTWVRQSLAPALQAAGLRVCLDIQDFVPGRDLMLEMTRAGQTSKRGLCVLSEDYFAGNRMVHFEALGMRRRDPGGFESRLVPLIFRKTNLPEWIRGLVPVDWTQESGRQREWRKLLDVLDAPHHVPPPATTPVTRFGVQEPDVIFIHDHNLPRSFIGREGDLQRLGHLIVGSMGKSATRVLAITAIGGVGKSSLCRELIEQGDIRSTFSRIIWFSFYEARFRTAADFFRDVLFHGFGWESSDHRPLKDDDLRRKLSKFMDEQRILLVLDGMEAIQFADDPTAATYGRIHWEWTEVGRFLTHVLNNSPSVCLVSSRIPFRDYENKRGYLNYELDQFSPRDAARLLDDLGVRGTAKELEQLASYLGGHALSLVAAGRYMARRGITSDKFVDLVEDPNIFRSNAEAEKVERICQWYRLELSGDQQFFLSRVGLHIRSVSVHNYSVLVRDYNETNARYVEEKIVQPLVERGLVDRLRGNDGTVRLTAHPLLKLAFSTWLEPTERKRTREEWARAAAGSPGYLGSFNGTIEELQPFIDAVSVHSPKVRGSIALAEGEYSKAARLMQTALKSEHGHNWSVLGQQIGDALIRDGKMTKASWLLGQILSFAIERRFVCCQIDVLAAQIDISLRQNNVEKAQQLSARRDGLRCATVPPGQPHFGLLLREKELRQALEIADQDIRNYPSSVIERHVRRARVFSASNDQASAKHELEAAKRKAQASGYHRFDDEIRELWRE